MIARGQKNRGHSLCVLAVARGHKDLSHSFGKMADPTNELAQALIDRRDKEFSVLKVDRTCHASYVGK